jgi:hypothetical protein
MSPREARSKPRAEAPQETKDSSCCCRFQFSDGFLIDTVTGELWRYNETAGALVAIPRVEAKTADPANRQQIVDQMQKAMDARAEMWAAVNSLFT